MPRPQAQSLVKAAVADLRPARRCRTPSPGSEAPVGWTAFADPARHAGAAAAPVDRVLAAI